MAGQIYSNNDLLWQDSSLVEPLSRSWNMPRYWNLPASSLKQGENILWIRVVAVHSQNSGIGQLLLGTANEVMPKYYTFWQQQRVLMFFNLVFSLTLGLVAFLVWLFHRKDSVFGWFSLASLAWVMVMSNVTMLNPPLGLTTLQLARISSFCFFIYSVLSCFYAWRLAQQCFPRLEKALFILSFLVLIATILIPNTQLTFLISWLFFVSIFILLINFFSYPFIAYRVKRIEPYLLSIVFIIFIIVSIHDTFVIMGTIRDTSWMPYTAPLSTLFIAMILAMRLAKNIRQIEYFNKTLGEKVTQATNELAISLNTQHKLELENTKLQERINLAHDLHDSLGGSLVRSIAIVDQSNQNLTNPQFLSMLKLLRSDLRQIIDSGSSSCENTPDTPIIWAAAIRYRFEQIFDELDIESTWHFPDTWQNKPSHFECLTFLRVIEEALTNILKHSQADDVRVIMSYPDTQTIAIEIVDNGIGFDVETTLSSNMSIGLRSMKIRLEKIQAKLSIQSKVGKSSVKIVKIYARD